MLLFTVIFPPSQVVWRSSESCVCWMRGRKGLILSVASCFNGAASHFIWPYLTFRGRDTLPHQNKLPLTSQGRGSAQPWGCSGHQGCMGTTTHYTQMYVCATQENNALCILSLDNTNAFQDQHSIVSCTFSFLAQGDFCTKYFPGVFLRFYSVVSCRKTFRGKTQEELMSVKVQKKFQTLCFCPQEHVIYRETPLWHDGAVKSFRHTNVKSHCHPACDHLFALILYFIFQYGWL